MKPRKSGPYKIRKKNFKIKIKAIQQQHQSMFQRRIFSCKEKRKGTQAVYITFSHRRQNTKQKIEIN
jgi:hypothetical protein